MASLANVATLADDEEFDIINCVGLYYEKGASGNTFLRNPDFQPRFQGLQPPLPYIHTHTHTRPTPHR